MVKSKKSGKIENEKVCALLSYLLVGIIWYFVDEKMKKSSFAKYHVKQGLILLFFELIFSALASVPIIGWFIIWPIGYIASIIFLILGIINSLNGKEAELPIIGQFAAKLNF